jgi:acyl carrier protein
MTADEVRERVLELARRELGEALPPLSAPLEEHLDSMKRMALVVAIEDAFEIALEPEDDEAVATLDDVVAVVLRHLGDG